MHDSRSEQRNAARGNTPRKVPTKRNVPEEPRRAVPSRGADVADQVGAPKSVKYPQAATSRASTPAAMASFRNRGLGGLGGFGRRN